MLQTNNKAYIQLKPVKKPKGPNKFCPHWVKV